jgi:hypothetical protein
VSKRFWIRLCSFALALVIFALAWWTVGARPWQAEAKASVDPRLLALQEREAELRQQAEDARLLLEERWATYRHKLKLRQKAIAAAERRHRHELKRAKLAAEAAARAPRVVTVSVSAPSVQIVSLPPVAKTKSS